MYSEILSNRHRTLEFISGPRLQRPSNWRSLPRTERAAFAQLRKMQSQLLTGARPHFRQEVFSGVVEFTGNQEMPSLN